MKCIDMFLTDTDSINDWIYQKMIKIYNNEYAVDKYVLANIQINEMIDECIRK